MLKTFLMRTFNFLFNPLVQDESGLQPVVTGHIDNGRKFHLASDLSKTIGTDQIGKKIMDTPVQSSIQGILAVSGDVAGYLHDQTQKGRIPIEISLRLLLQSTATSAASATSPTTSLVLIQQVQSLIMLFHLGTQRSALMTNFWSMLHLTMVLKSI
jgi:hypothetical protein